MKILGILAVVGSCIGIGLTSIGAVRQEIRTLEGLAQGIHCIRAELSSRLCPMQELLMTAERQAGPYVCAFFHSCADALTELNSKCFAELWSNACCAFLPALSENERIALEVLGATLGRYELDEQLAACDRYLRSCEDAAEKLRLKLPEQRRLSLALSTAAGVFLCLMIL